MEKYYIGAKSQREAEDIALQHGLTGNQWTRAHCGLQCTLYDGIHVLDRKFLLGQFTENELFILTAHLPEENTSGKA